MLRIRFLALSSLPPCRWRKRVRRKIQLRPLFKKKKKKSAVSLFCFAQGIKKEKAIHFSSLDGRKKRATGRNRKKSIREMKKRNPLFSFSFAPSLSLSLSLSRKPPKLQKKRKEVQVHSLKPSAASCTPFIALPLISCVPAQLGSHPTASGVEQAMDSPLGTVASADFEG